MGNDEFNGKALAEKLLKLNNSAQSIESLSRLCVSHRKRAKYIVETWNKLFNSHQKEQRIPFLYLANDILQNSRRKGSEFVNEFWKVLPAALERVYESDEPGKKVVVRLIDIWEERKVFGSRAQGLKDKITGKSPAQGLKDETVGKSLAQGVKVEKMGKSPLPSSASNGTNSNPIKIAKRDAQSLRLKVAVGCLPEKILTALHSVYEEDLKEGATITNCDAAICQVGILAEDIENTLSQGNQLGSTIVNDLQRQEEELRQYVVQLENAEAARATLLSQLKEALQEQESRQKLVHSQLLAAQNKIEWAANIRKRLSQAPEATGVLEQNLPSVQPNSSTPPQSSFTQPSISFAPLQTTEEDKKAAAAAVAAKLAASTSSALMLTSVLSSLAAEEAAFMNGSLNSTGFTSGLPGFHPEKRPKLEQQLPVTDVNNSDAGSSSFFATLQQPSGGNVPLTPTMQPFASAPPPPQMNPPANHYAQSPGMMVGGNPYAYGSNNLPPPPPPLPPHVAMGLSRPSSQPPQSPQSQQQQPQSPAGGFYGPPGFGFYGQSHSSTPPAPVPRQ